jgi:hypothetical protein
MNKNRRYINRERILERDGYVCCYCFERRATEVDHIMPVAYAEMDEDSNLISSCRDCNAIAGSQVFESIDVKRAYIQAELAKPKWQHRRAMERIDPLPLTMPAAAEQKIEAPKAKARFVDMVKNRRRSKTRSRHTHEIPSNAILTGLETTKKNGNVYLGIFRASRLFWSLLAFLIRSRR